MSITESLAAGVASLGDGSTLRFSSGTITAVTWSGYGALSNHVSALFDGETDATKAIPNIRCLSHQPRVGDTGWFAIWDTDRLLIGTVGTSGPPDDIAAVTAAIALVNNPPRAKVIKTDAWNVPDRTVTPVGWTSAVHQRGTAGPLWFPDNFTRLVAPVSGTYGGIAGWVWGHSTADGRRIATVLANGSVDASRDEKAGSGAYGVRLTHAVPWECDLAAGEYVELQIFWEGTTTPATLAYDHERVGLNFMTMRRICDIVG